MKDRRLEIRDALESMKAAERAADFEDLAGHIAKRRWPELVMTQRKSDGGEDLTSFSPCKDGKIRRCAISLTGTWAKVQADAQRQRQRFLATDVLVFITSEPVTNLVVAEWREKFKAKFGYDLEILSQADLINELEKPESDRLCEQYLNFEPPAKDFDRFENLVSAARPYLEYIAPLCQRLPLIGLDPSARDTRFTLEAVYTALNTRSTEEESIEGKRHPDGRSEPLSVLRAVAHCPLIVLKGDPGSGKSTFCSHLSLCLAKHHLDPEGKWLERLEDWPEQNRWIPITIVMRDFARALPEPLPTPCARLLWDFFLKNLADAQLSRCATALEAALDTGQAIVFLDGLDEVPTAAQRDFVQECVLAFAERYDDCTVVLTSRTIPYEVMLHDDDAAPIATKVAGIHLGDIPAFELAPFDDEKITRFITAWYTAHVPKPFSREVAEERRAGLAQAVHRPELRRLAGNPMLLTDMALLHTHRGRLPDDRAKLYKEVIDLLLLRWEETKAGGGLQDLLREAKRDDNDLIRTLGAVAFAVHSRSRQLKADETGDIQRHELLDALEALHPQKSLDWAKRVILTIERRAGLLIAREEHVFAFPHRSFQEYLAAAHLTKDRDFASKALTLLDETGYWREVIKWAAGRVTHVDDVVEWKGFALLRKLCRSEKPPSKLRWHRVWLAGEALLEMSLAKVTQFDDGPELITRIRGLLKQLFAQKALTTFERAQAGIALGRLGDDRPGVGTRPGTRLKTIPDLDWTPVIQPTDFIMGGKEDWQGKMQFKHRLQHPFCLAVYPVTVAQFELFIQDGGYSREEFWTKAGWHWREQEQQTRPFDYESVFQTPNCPRVGVTWYEAVAFCYWLHATFTPQELRLPDKNWRVRLPSEAEWERAARHTDGREFPWDTEDEAEPDTRCNCREAGIHSTSAVGLFLGGNAVCGAKDMAGNVWQWCLTKWRSDHKNHEKQADQRSEGGSARVVRGGSWANLAYFASCAHRFKYEPALRLAIIGFRVVASPFFPRDSDPSACS